MTETEQLSEEDLKELELAAKKLEVSDEVVIRIIEMHKWFDDFHVLIDINLEVNRRRRSSSADRRDRVNRP